MKRKTLTLVLCLLTVMSLVGVGFASWVISANDTETVGGNIVVDTVADKRLEITVPTQEVSLVFCGLETNASTYNGWLQYDNGTADDVVQNLKVTYACSVKLKGQNLTLPLGNTQTGDTVKVGIKLDAQFTVPEEVNNAVKKGCLEMITTNHIQKIELSADKTTLYFDLVVEYQWGTVFGGMNPFKFYNDGTHAVDGLIDADVMDGETKVLDKTKDTWGDHANYFLSLLSKIDKDASNAERYSFTITATYVDDESLYTEATLKNS